MKAISVALGACIVSLTLIHASNTASITKEKATKKLLACKQKNALVCGAGDSSGFADYNINFPLLQEWSKMRMPFTLQNEQYNTLWIPDTLSGTTFELRIHDTAKQYLIGATTQTMAFNNCSILGPT